jgi:hypothetical protein
MNQRFGTAVKRLELTYSLKPLRADGGVVNVRQNQVLISKKATRAGASAAAMMGLEERI